MCCKVISWIALVLVVIGALNWGMWGFFQIDVVGNIFGGSSSTGARVVFAIVGLAGLWSLSFFRHFCCSSCCSKCHCDPCCCDSRKGDKGSCCR